MSDQRTEIPIFDVWKEYEKIAMHFNDLLMKIRTQGLGVVATLSTLIGIMSATDEGGTNWFLLMIGFFVLSMIWLAIWFLDFLYYNRLLIGAVIGLREVEARSKTEATVNEIQLSTRIEQVVANKLTNSDSSISKPKVGTGRWIFYGLVMAVLLALSAVSLVMLATTGEAEPPPAPALVDYNPNSSSG